MRFRRRGRSGRRRRSRRGRSSFKRRRTTRPMRIGYRM